MISYEKELISLNNKEIKALNELSGTYLNVSCDQVGNHIQLIEQIKRKFSQKSFLDSLFLNSKFLFFGCNKLILADSFIENSVYALVLENHPLQNKESKIVLLFISLFLFIKKKGD